MARGALELCIAHARLFKFTAVCATRTVGCTKFEGMPVCSSPFSPVQQSFYDRSCESEMRSQLRVPTLRFGMSDSGKDSCNNTLYDFDGGLHALLTGTVLVEAALTFLLQCYHCRQ